VRVYVVLLTVLVFSSIFITEFCLAAIFVYTIVQFYKRLQESLYRLHVYTRTSLLYSLPADNTVWAYIPRANNNRIRHGDVTHRRRCRDNACAPATAATTNE